MKKFSLEDEYIRVAKEYNLTVKQIKEIYESQFNFARKAIGEGIHNEPETFKNINFIKLGKLYTKPRVLEHMKRVNLLIKQKQIDAEQNN